MKVNGCNINLFGNNPGFTLPSTIGELGDITTLGLSLCSLRGAHSRTRPVVSCISRIQLAIQLSHPNHSLRPVPGRLPTQLGRLSQLTELLLYSNGFEGA